MSDDATLGFAVDSSGIDRATAALKGLNVTAAQTAQVQKAVEEGARKAGVSFNEMARAVYAASAPLKSQSEQVNRVGAAHQSAAKSAQDMVAALTGGRGGGGGVSGAMDQADRSTRNLVETLSRRFVVGFLLTQMRQLVTTVTDLNTEIAKTGDIGKFTRVGGQGIQGLMNVAATSGIAPAKFLDDFLGFSRQVDLAKQSVGDLGSLLRANNIPVKSTEDAFDRVADLVRNAGDDMRRLSILQQAGLPATREWLNYMSRGADAIAKAGSESTKLTNKMLEDQAAIEKKFNDLWNNFSLWGKRAVTDVFNADNWKISVTPGSLADKVLQAMFGNGEGGYGPPKPPPTLSQQMPWFSTWAGEGSGDAPRGPAPIDPQKQINALKLQNAGIALLGDLASASDKAKVASNNLTLAWLEQGVSAGKNNSKILEMQATVVQGAQIQLRAANGIVTADELMAQKQRELAILVFNGTMTQEQANVALANYARHAKDAAEAAQVYSSKLPQLTQAALDANNAYKQADQFIVGGINNTANALADATLGTKTLGKAITDLSKTAARDFLVMIYKAQLFKLAMGVTGLGGFGSITSFFGGGAEAPSGGTVNGVGIYGEGQFNPLDAAVRHGGGMANFGGARRFVHRANFDFAPRYHKGIDYAGGEIPAILKKGEEVGWPGDLARKYGSKQNVTINSPITIEDHAGVKIDAQPETDGQGGQRMRIVVQNMVAGALSDPTSKASTAARNGQRMRPRKEGL